MAAIEYPVFDQDLDEIGKRGYEIYARIKSILEPDHLNSFVAIHVNSGDYEIARTAAVAKRSLRRRNPSDGDVFIRKIGDEPEYGLAARFLAGQMNSQYSI